MTPEPKVYMDELGQYGCWIDRCGDHPFEDCPSLTEAQKAHNTGFADGYGAMTPRAPLDQAYVRGYIRGLRWLSKEEAN